MVINRSLATHVSEISYPNTADQAIEAEGRHRMVIIRNKQSHVRFL